jgi:hypothetical protein
MPTKPGKSISPRATVALSHRIHALLHTVRAIARYEDELCTLLHETELTAYIPADTAAELLHLLDHIPSHEYLNDLEILRSSLPRTPAAPRPARTPAKPRKKITLSSAKKPARPRKTIPTRKVRKKS